jgi:aminoglycoside phosphotransferase (APT) family kinase protein
MITIDTELSPALLAWMGEIGGGNVIRAERFPHTRPMWEVDVARPDGAVAALFARGDRTASVLNARYDVGREARVVTALARAGVPTPRPLGYSDEHKVLLFQRVRGDNDFSSVRDPARRGELARQFIELIADLHALDVDALDLDAIGVPRTADEIALDELRIGERLFARSSHDAEPIITLCRKWLRENVPRQATEVVFLQGDTGPGNFLFAGDRVTYLLDWEIAHFGDPMEDLAAICVRDMVTPFVDLQTLFVHYARYSGRTIDVDRIRFHRVSKCVRSLYAIVSVTSHPDAARYGAVWPSWLRLYLRSAGQALAEAMQVDVEGGSVAGDDDVERAELSALLGEPIASERDGLRRLDARIDAASSAGDCIEALRYLYRRADRAVNAARASMGALADSRFSPIA